MRFALILAVPLFMSAYDAPQAKASSDGSSDVNVDFALGRQLLDKCASTNDANDCQKLLDFNEGFSAWEGSKSHYPELFFLKPTGLQSSNPK